MPKSLFTIILCIAVCFLVSCNKTTAESTQSTSPENTNVASIEPVDIDLSELSVNMVYSEVYNMMYSPEEYDGKTVRISGLFSAIYENVEENDLRFTCQISDATACCSIGIEFIPDSSLVFPDDFPIDYTRITVRGTLKARQEEIPIYISDAVIEK